MPADQELAPYAKRMTDRLVHYQATPDHTFIAQRERLADGGTGDWKHISYAQTLAAARSIAQALMDRKLSAERPVIILSENDLDHAMLASCLYAGVPYCSASTVCTRWSAPITPSPPCGEHAHPWPDLCQCDAWCYDKAVKAASPEGCEVVYGKPAVGCPAAHLVCRAGGDAGNPCC